MKSHTYQIDSSGDKLLNSIVLRVTTVTVDVGVVVDLSTMGLQTNL